MDELNLIYEAVGSGPEKVLARFGGNEEMLRHFLRLFAKDDCFANLQAALAAGNTADAFRAVHTLKGICVNLGFERLYERASEITELLRCGDIDSAKQLFPELAEEYGKVIEMLN